MQGIAAAHTHNISPPIPLVISGVVRFTALDTLFIHPCHLRGSLCDGPCALPRSSSCSFPCLP
jgi:hypothetical protein